ncbi:phosphoenolpyruvate--protein phosphotransferase [Candidatus Mycoplasma haematohominis]|uniref:phosphoenolpyruvate--protein phosphotransferase n=1 Tax=Candidatus Mycoplasma haematohominis TaxID=1494318 RepID=UPI001C0A6E5B|nr:phosphoenolpyruvate--protein phosphotransferase [Candidatus Mycoplasma haemohominis]
MSKQFKGIGVGDGVGIGKVFLLQDPEFNYKEESTDQSKEWDYFLSCQQEVISQIEGLIKIATEKISPEKGEIFQAHLEIAKDEQIHEEIKKLINEGKSAAWSVNEVFNKYQMIFEGMEDDYFKERASDIKDLKRRFLACVCQVKLPDLLLIQEESIIIAHDLSPSETAMLNKKYIKGFATNIGGATSHSAIMAKTLEIPAIVSLKNITNSVKEGEIIAIDAREGIVETDLSPEEINNWEQKREDAEESKKELEKFKTGECIMKDGTKIPLRGNIGQPKDLKKVIEYGGKGVGLFRSEFLYMESQDWPTEEEQYQAYSEVLEKNQGEPITIRTLDIGGDKHLNYFTFPKEMNPFLGYRALRLSLDKREIFKTQLRALLRASEKGKLKIMFPMVATVDEFTKAKAITKEVEEELIKEGKAVSKDYQIGMMVEIPSTAVISKAFAKEADFFSVGSNDLIQYTHAADRMSEEVNYLYQPNNPSILTLIKYTVEGARKYSREVSVCGEMASNPISAIILVGLGINSLSMSATAIPSIKRVLSQLNLEECRDIAMECVDFSTEEEVLNYVKSYLAQQNIRY